MWNVGKIANHVMRLGFGMKEVSLISTTRMLKQEFYLTITLRLSSNFSYKHFLNKGPDDLYDGLYTRNGVRCYKNGFVLIHLLCFLLVIGVILTSTRIEIGAIQVTD